MHKLHLFGINYGPPMGMVSAVFSKVNQYHSVDINNQLSDNLPVLSGVPQSNILGPLLFIHKLMICLNLLRIHLFLMFADARGWHSHMLHVYSDLRPR